jgi:hypothetical protein
LVTVDHVKQRTDHFQIRRPRLRTRTRWRTVLIWGLGIGVGIAIGLDHGSTPPSHAEMSLPTPLDPPTAVQGQRWVSSHEIIVRSAPDHSAPVRGRIPATEPFSVVASIGLNGCKAPGWVETEGNGFACIAGAKQTEEAPVRLPRLVRFVHPDPAEWDTYNSTMTYDTDPVDRIDAMVPFIYAKRWGKWRGPNYSSAAAFEAGRPPSQRLGRGRKYHFVDSIQTDRGPVLQRANGAVVPASEVHIYPLTKFHGWDLDAEPIPADFLTAWAIDYEGTPVHTAPSHAAPVGTRLAYHTEVLVEDEPVDRAGHWWMMPNGLGPGVPGYVNDNDGIRHWAPSEPPDQIGSSQLWLDVDLDQQVLGLRRGSDLLFVTLISSGAPGTATPRGIYAIQDKSAWTDMASRPDSDDPYYVEKVPWVMHFKKRYALHGTFWHWGFGHTASHGCINLSVQDARWIFDRVSPSAHGGWQAAVAHKTDPGTVLRVRRGPGPVPDRRR